MVNYGLFFSHTQHYTSIAHTPESNRLTMSTSSSAQAAAVGAATAPSLANGGAIKSTSFPQQQQLISYPAVAAAQSSSPTISGVSPAATAPAPAQLHGGSRSGSITSNASGSGNNGQQLQLQHQLQQQQQHPHPSRHPALSSGSSSIDFGDMAHGLRQHQQQHQQQLYQQHHHHQQLLSNSFMR